MARAVRAGGRIKQQHLILLLASPVFLGYGFTEAGPEALVLMAAGLLMLVYSIFTDYELVFFRSIPMRAHLTLRLLAGLFLAASPPILGFADRAYLPHVIIGLLEVGAAHRRVSSALRAGLCPKTAVFV